MTRAATPSPGTPFGWPDSAGRRQAAGGWPLARESPVTFARLSGIIGGARRARILSWASLRHLSRTGRYREVPEPEAEDCRRAADGQELIHNMRVADGITRARLRVG